MPLLISYDLNKTKNYGALIDAIQELGPYWPVLKSAWVVSTPLSPMRVAEHLERVMDADDDLFVVDITGATAAWSDSYSEQATQWLQENLGR